MAGTRFNRRRFIDETTKRYDDLIAEQEEIVSTESALDDAEKIQAWRARETTRVVEFAQRLVDGTVEDHELEHFETKRAPDVGGVWSATRRYPGLGTQNTKDTYAFSDFPMPRDYPEWPSGAQVQRYLEDYVDHADLGALLRLGSEVTDARPRPGGGWTVTSRKLATGEVTITGADHLVVANGIFSAPKIPHWPGADAFRAAGGRIWCFSTRRRAPGSRPRCCRRWGAIPRSCAGLSRSSTDMTRG